MGRRLASESLIDQGQIGTMAPAELARNHGILLGQMAKLMGYVKAMEEAAKMADTELARLETLLDSVFERAIAAEARAAALEDREQARMVFWQWQGSFGIVSQAADSIDRALAAEAELELARDRELAHEGSMLEALQRIRVAMAGTARS